jgi:hypothetical protein
MWNKINTQMLSFALFLCTPAYAQDTEEEPMYTHLEQGEAAPFAGTLFNPPATAELITAHQYSLTECDLLVEYEVAKAQSEMQLELDTLRISYNAQNERMNLLFEIKEQEIDMFREMALDQPNKNNHWWLAGGTIAGIGLSLGVFYAATNIAQ